MNINQTVTALQLSGNVRLWAVKFSAEREHHYKSERALIAGQSVVVAGKNGVYIVGTVAGEVANVDFDSDIRFGWILSVVDDPKESEAHYEHIDATAAQKIAYSRVKQEAARYLADTNLDVADFEVPLIDIVITDAS